MTNIISSSHQLNSPVLDARTLPDLIAQMKEIAPYYTPEWRFSPEDPDPGTALFYLAAEMLQANISRLNRVPIKNFIAFLNMLQIQLQSVRPAQGQVIFRLNEGVYEPVWIPVGTQVSAIDPETDEDLLFETVEPLLVTPSLLTELYSTSAAHDRIVCLSDDYAGRNVAPPPAVQVEAQPLMLFHTETNGHDLQAHDLYLRHDQLLHITQGAVVHLLFEHTGMRYKQEELVRTLAESELVEWSYPHEGKWEPFEEVRAEQHVLKLTKRRACALEEVEVCGILGKWIRCRLTKPERGRSLLLEEPVSFDKLGLYTTSLPDGEGAPLVPEMLFHNDIELSGDGFHPFGEHFTPYASFYISSDEVFDKPRVEVSLMFNLQGRLNALRTAPDPEINWKMIMKKHEVQKPPPPRIQILSVQWEYWNGDGWVRIPGTARYSKLFTELDTEKPVPVQVTFQLPADFQPTFVNAQFKCWLRIRVLTMDQLAAPETIYVSPWLTDVKLSYGYEGFKFPAQNVLTHNNLAYRDRTYEALEGGQPFQPFEPLDCPHPAVYAAFALPMRSGPIRLHFALQPARYAPGRQPWVEWQYWGREEGESGWLPLKCIDGTNHLTESGTLQFVGPPGMMPKLHFGRERYWLRAVNRDGRFEEADIPCPVLKRAELNAVLVRQQQTIRDELPEKKQAVYQLSAAPVIDEEVWLDETGQLSGAALETYQREKPQDIEVLLDSEGLLQRVWVRWQHVEAFLHSGAADRHYTLDRATGTLRFGNGIQGMVPPNEGPDKVRVHYKVTMGKKGNVPPGAITSLQQSIAFVAGVVNPEAMGGGCDTEPLAHALRRGPERLKHRDRAVTAGDFEWLAREAYPDLVKVRCLPNRNALMEQEAGAVTVVVLPRGGHPQDPLFAPIKRQIEQYLLARTAGGLALGGRVQVIEPAFLEVAVHATAYLERMEEALAVEEEVTRRLQAFLHPVTGNNDGQGWEIGETVHFSVFHSLIVAVPGVRYIDKLYLSVLHHEGGNCEEIDTERQRKLPHALVISGKHRIQVTMDASMNF